MLRRAGNICKVQEVSMFLSINSTLDETRMHKSSINFSQGARQTLNNNSSGVSKNG